MNPILILDILGLAVKLSRRDDSLADSDVAAALLTIIRKGVLAYQEHTGRLLDPSLIKPEAPV